MRDHTFSAHADCLWKTSLTMGHVTGKLLLIPLETSCISKANKNENLPAYFKISMLNIPQGINEIQNAKSR